MTIKVSRELKLEYNHSYMYVIAAVVESAKKTRPLDKLKSAAVIQCTS